MRNLIHPAPVLVLQLNFNWCASNLFAAVNLGGQYVDKSDASYLYQNAWRVLLQ